LLGLYLQQQPEVIMLFDQPPLCRKLCLHLNHLQCADPIYSANR
jgi:hypothetical protein